MGIYLGTNGRSLPVSSLWGSDEETSYLNMKSNKINTVRQEDRGSLFSFSIYQKDQEEAALNSGL